MRFDLVAIYSSARGQISNSMARTMMKNLVFASPLLNLLIFYYIFNRSGVQNAGEHVIVASALMTMWGTILWSSATDIGRERWMGTFELLLISPVPFPTILLGKILGNMALSLLAIALNWLYARLFFGIKVVVAHPVQLLLTVAAAFFAFVGFSLMMALLMTLSRQANQVANGLSYPIYLVSGILFPLTALPTWVLPLGLAMPLAWAREATRWATTGAAAAPELITPSWVWAEGGLVLLGAIYFLASFGLYRLIFEKRLRKLGVGVA